MADTGESQRERRRLLSENRPEVGRRLGYVVSE